MTRRRTWLFSMLAVAACGREGLVVRQVSPDVARSGDAVTIAGSGFGERVGHVRFGAAQAVVQTWSTDAVTVVVPQQTQPDVQLSLEREDGASTSVPFVVWDAMADASGAPGAAKTFVSITFDDTTADQLTLKPVFMETGVRATFYVNSARIGGVSSELPAYMDLASLLALQDEGHEIGGHSKHHLDPTFLDRDELVRQVCGDRERLLSLGLRAQTFAYPFGRSTASVEQVVEACGYRAARSLDPQSDDWPLALPAPNHFALPAALAVTSSTTLEKLQSIIDRAEKEPDRWAVLVFHRVCDESGPCPSTGIKRTVFEAFVRWLAQRSTAGTVTRTVRQMLGAGREPTTTVPEPPARTTPNLIVNPSLESFSNGTINPDCWLLADTGHELTHWSKVAPGRDGEWAVRLSAGDPLPSNRRMKMMQDDGRCAPPVLAGGLYEFSVWYQSSVPLRFNSFLRDEQGFWAPDSLSPVIAASATWTRATWKLPPMPRAARAVTVSIRLQSGDGTMTIDDASLTRVEP